MGQFRLWLNRLIYRFTVSSEELEMCRSDRKLMNNLRRTFNEVETKMSEFEKNGGSCSEVGGSGVSLNLMGFRVYVFRPVTEKKKGADHSGESTVVQLDKYRTR